MIGQSLRFAPYTIATASLLYLLVLITLYTLQRQVQYQPSHRNPSPAAVGLTGVQVITLPTPDGADLVLWYAPPAPDRPTLLFFHGNAGEIADRSDRFAYYQRHDFGVAFLSYRGFGGSTGTISETGLLTDARTAYDWLTAQGTPPDRIGLVGESLGTGVAVQLVARVPIGAVALGAPYTSTADVAAWRFPWLPVRWLMKDQFRSIDYIAAINAPDSVRAKFISPEAEAVSDCSTAPRLITVIGMKNSGMPMPWISCGIAIDQKPMSVLH